MSKFDREFKRASEEIETKLEKTFRATAIQLFAEIVRKTPVGDPSLWNVQPSAGYRGGSLRGNWQASLTSPKVTTLDVQDNSGSSTVRAAEASINRFKLKDKSIWFSNNLPYANRVEMGTWSQQAPQGMMRVSVMQFRRVLDRVAKVNLS